MPEIDARPFLERCAFVFSWDNLLDKTVMDVGCGTGENSTNRIVEMFPRVEKVIGIDTDVDCIYDAECANRTPNTCYFLWDIQKWSDVEELENEIDIIVSHLVFDCLKDQTEAFRNIYKLLKKGGTAGILFTLQSDKYDWLEEVAREYSRLAVGLDFHTPDTHTLTLSVLHYKQLLEEVLGFRVLLIDQSYHHRQFDNKEECKRELGAMCPITPRIPANLMEDYLEDIYQIYIKRHPVNENGQVDFTCTTARIFLLKE